MKKGTADVPCPESRGSVGLLVGAVIAWWRVHLVTVRIRALRRNDRQRVLQRKVQDSFGGQLDLLALGCRLNATTETSTSRCADSCAFTASGKAANDGADSCTSADLLGSVLASGTALTLVLVSRHRVGLAIHGDSIELQHEQRLACKLTGALDVDY